MLDWATRVSGGTPTVSRNDWEHCLVSVIHARTNTPQIDPWHHDCITHPAPSSVLAQWLLFYSHNCAQVTVPYHVCTNVSAQQSPPLLSPPSLNNGLPSWSHQFTPTTLPHPTLSLCWLSAHPHPHGFITAPGHPSLPASTMHMHAFYLILSPCLHYNSLVYIPSLFLLPQCLQAPLTCTLPILPISLLWLLASCAQPPLQLLNRWTLIHSLLTITLPTHVY